MKKGVKPTIQNSKPMDLNHVKLGNNWFDIKREKIEFDICLVTVLYGDGPKLNSFRRDDKT